MHSEIEVGGEIILQSWLRCAESPCISDFFVAVIKYNQGNL